MSTDPPVTLGQLRECTLHGKCGDGECVAVSDNTSAGKQPVVAPAYSLRTTVLHKSHDLCVGN